MASVEVEDLSKTYRVPVRDPGLAASIRALFHREHRDVVAVDKVNFSVAPGEVVGFLGPNGAGKTTTLKMLSGLLVPTSGVGRVLGYEPQQREKKFLQRIALVMGNRNSMQWDLPAADSFMLNRAVYDIAQADFEHRRDRFIELLDAGELIDKPVRNLSLGERMKVEIIAALLHAPEVLFLDEPTIGLDITMQRRLREFVLDYAAEFGAAVLLTSHYMADVVAMCKRVIVIHRGSILFDGDLDGLADRFSNRKTITVTSATPIGDVSHLGATIAATSDKVVLQVDRSEVASATNQILADYEIIDLSIEDPPIEDVIEHAFTQGEETSGHPTAAVPEGAPGDDPS